MYISIIIIHTAGAGPETRPDIRLSRSGFRFEVLLALAGFLFGPFRNHRSFPIFFIFLNFNIFDTYLGWGGVVIVIDPLKRGL